MKIRTLLSFLPAACVVAIAMAGWWKLRIDGREAREELAVLPRDREATQGVLERSTLSALVSASSDEERELATAAMDSLLGKLASLKSEVAESKAALAGVRSEIEEILAKTPVAPDEITTSFGKITDMGREMGGLIGLFSTAMPGQSADGNGLGDLSDEEMEKAGTSVFKLMAWAPLIGEMESTPSDFARFQAAAFRETYDLDDAAAARLESLVMDHISRMDSQGLTISGRPVEKGEAADEWKSRRGRALAELMTEIRPLLPEGDPIVEKTVFPILLNAGIGSEVQTLVTGEGESEQWTTHVGLPTWPVPPWLEE